jgi:hypothetical protein
MCVHACVRSVAHQSLKNVDQVIGGLSLEDRIKALNLLASQTMVCVVHVHEWVLKLLN